MIKVREPRDIIPFMPKPEGPLDVLEKVVRSQELRDVLTTGLTNHLDRLEELNRPTEEEVPQIAEDEDRFKELLGVIASGFQGLVLRDSVLWRQGARVNFSKPGDLNRRDRRMLRLIDEEGRKLTVREYVVNVEILAAGSPTHRADMKSGHTVSAATVAGRKGFGIRVQDQDVSIHPRAEVIQWAAGAGISAQIRDNGNVTVLAEKYSGRMPYEAQPLDLSEEFPTQGKSLLSRLREILPD